MKNDQKQTQPQKLLTIGGWDPCGAFGVPADLKTFAALDTHGMGVMTVVTAQNSVGWYGAEFIPADFVAQQLDAVLGDYGADGVKTGFLGRVDLIEIIGAKLREYQIKNIVIDPVLINAGGRPMFGPEVLDAYKEWLFPLATAITPNRYELSLLVNGETELWALSDESVSKVFEWQEQLGGGEGQSAVIAKGLELEEGHLADALLTNGQMMQVSHAKVDTQNVSGTGDSLSAALTAFLACGATLEDAFEKASLATAGAIALSADWQLGQGPGPIAHKGFS